MGRSVGGPFGSKARKATARLSGSAKELAPDAILWTLRHAEPVAVGVGVDLDHDLLDGGDRQLEAGDRWDAHEAGRSTPRELRLETR